jgi:GTP cyclohydrolase II
MPDSLQWISTGQVTTKYGDFRADVFLDDCGNTPGRRQITVLHTGGIPGKQENVCCRIQYACVGQAVFERFCDCATQVASSLRRIQKEKTGLLILLPSDGMCFSTDVTPVYSPDHPAYACAVRILRYYDIRSVNLLTISKAKVEAVSRAQIAVRQWDWPGGLTVPLGPQASRTMHLVRHKHSYAPVARRNNNPKVLVVGDLNVDFIIEKGQVQSGPQVGGSGFNAAIAFEGCDDFQPVIFGKVGRDEHGVLIQKAIQKRGVYLMLGIHDQKATGRVEVHPLMATTGSYHYHWDKRNNANDYDAQSLDQACVLADIGKDDYVYLTSYLFVQKFFQIEAIREVLAVLQKTGARIVLDLARSSFVPKVLSDCEVTEFTKEQLKACLCGVSLYAVIGEMLTFNQFGIVPLAPPQLRELTQLMQWFSSKWIVARHLDVDTIKQSCARLLPDRALMPGITPPIGIAAKLEIGAGDKAAAALLGEMRRFDANNFPEEGSGDGL